MSSRPPTPPQPPSTADIPPDQSRSSSSPSHEAGGTSSTLKSSPPLPKDKAAAEDNEEEEEAVSDHPDKQLPQDHQGAMGKERANGTADGEDDGNEARVNLYNQVLGKQVSPSSTCTKLGMYAYMRRKLT
jgi:hypothetical protein